LLRICEPSIFDSTIKRNEIMTITNTFGIQVGDTITFINNLNYKISKVVTRVEEKSWYCQQKARKSYGTIQDWSKMKDFQIIKGA